MLRPQLSSEVLLSEVEGSEEISGEEETGGFLMTRVYIQCIYARTIVLAILVIAILSTTSDSLIEMKDKSSPKPLSRVESSRLNRVLQSMVM